MPGEITIGYQGEPGAYSEEALHATLPMAMAQAFRTLRHAFHRVADQTIDLALVPVENSQAGSILETYDLLLEYRSLVVAEVALQVDHCLLIVPGADRRQLTRVLSHPKALAQCEAFIVRARRPLSPAGLLQRVRCHPEQARVATTPRSTLGIPLLPRCRRRSIRETGGGRPARRPPGHELLTSVGDLYARPATSRAAPSPP